LWAAWQPIYVVDAERKVAFANAACLAWTGLSEEELVGRRCDYHSHPRPEPAAEIAAALCPPPEVFRGQTLLSEIALPTRSEAEPRRAEFLPLGEAGEESAGVLVWVGVPGRETGGGKAEAGREWEPGYLHHCLRELRRRERQRYALPHLIGQSAAMTRVRDQVGLAARGADRVLIVGPAGSGREHIARSIHQQRGEADAPLIPLACDLLDAELLETTVTAFVQRLAKLETGRSGTLLLLDVQRLSAHAQARLFGTLAITELDLRTLATSSIGLDALLGDRQFRADLAYCLSTLTIELPALSAREEDIPLLAQWFVELANAEGGRQWTGFTAEAMERLVAYDWPGNVDELAQVVAETCRRSLGPSLRLEDLPESLRWAEQAAARPERKVETIDMDVFLEQIEAELIRRALRQARGNKTQAAKLLGLNRARLHRRVAQLGLDE
jgi:DNA-binding NtrC family response regulator